MFNILPLQIIDFPSAFMLVGIFIVMNSITEIITDNAHILKMQWEKSVHDGNLEKQKEKWS